MYIIQMIDGLTTGGAEQLQVSFAKEAKRSGLKLTVVSLDNPSDSQYMKQLRELGVPVYFFPTNRIFDLRNLVNILKLLRAEHPDILHVHLTYSYIIGSLTARLAGIPVVATLHATGIDLNLGPRTSWAEKIALRYLVHQVVACGPAVARYYQQTVKNVPIQVIPNAVDVSQVHLDFRERSLLRKELAGDAERFIIISVGRLIPQKGFEDLLDAFFILHSSHPNTVLVIAGSGDIKDLLERKIDYLRLSDQVKLLGWRTDVPALLAASDLFVLASHREGLPIAVLEAMSAGLPVLATDVSDNAWAIGETGTTVPAREPEMFASAMAGMVDDPARCKALGHAARMRIDEEFNTSVWFEKIVSVYKSLLH